MCACVITQVAVSDSRLLLLLVSWANCKMIPLQVVSNLLHWAQFCHIWFAHIKSCRIHHDSLRVTLVVNYMTKANHCNCDCHAAQVVCNRHASGH